jgi:hypothetical protein
MFVLASLDEEKLKTIQDLEREEGIRVIALQDVPVEPLSLDEAKVCALRELEEELGICLVAVR